MHKDDDLLLYTRLSGKDGFKGLFAGFDKCFMFLKSISEKIIRFVKSYRFVAVIEEKTFLLVVF
jgi:hypothetical protein